MWKPIILDVECIVCNKTLHKINHGPQHGTRDMGKVSTNRRLRTPNWSLEEKQYLLDLIKTRKDIVVTKNNNGPNYSEEKDVAWNDILHELATKFGSKFHGSSIKKVKTQWQNMKRIAREEISANGQMLQKYSRQSLQVCNILEMMKDGVPKVDNQNTNEVTMTANVEIKTECIDEEMDQPSCSSANNTTLSVGSEIQHNQANLNLNYTSTSISNSDQSFGNNAFEIAEKSFHKRNASVMTEPSCDTNNTCINKEMQDFVKYTEIEKQLKVEAMKEERQIIKAMRETAELNKIIAEQRLKHMLWIKKQEMA
ncbi:hypothetical protein O3G_MSEX014658 [Manduca sexta]|uniref:Regulatory protein zeste n=1 Tax=Manduca sexta TaxID=7130 RepID=A0A921ZW77_MANSE|nr:hypothetical protein O3G_MSEX014658 [Manduca sexta]